MITIIAWSIAFISISAFIALWFWGVRKELKSKLKMVEAAKSQVASSRMLLLKASSTDEEKMAQEIIDRSLHIYCQAVDIYNKTYYKVWNHLPGYLLSFNRIKK